MPTFARCVQEPEEAGVAAEVGGDEEEEEEEEEMDQLFGCSKCRYARGGCANCKDSPNFERPKSLRWQPDKGRPQTVSPAPITV